MYSYNFNSKFIQLVPSPSNKTKIKMNANNSSDILNSNVQNTTIPSSNNNINSNQYSLNQILEEEEEFNLDDPIFKTSRSSSMSSTISSATTSFNAFLMDEQDNQGFYNTEGIMKSPNLLDQGTKLVTSLSTISLLSLNTKEAAINTSFEQDCYNSNNNSPLAKATISLSQLTLGANDQLLLSSNKVSHSRASSFSNHATSVTSQQTQQHFQKKRHPSFTNYYSSHNNRRSSFHQQQTQQNAISTAASSPFLNHTQQQPIPINVNMNPQTPQINPSSLNNSPSGFFLNQTLPSSLQRTPTLSRKNSNTEQGANMANYKGMTVSSPKLTPIYSEVPMTPLTLNAPLNSNPLVDGPNQRNPFGDQGNGFI